MKIRSILERTIVIVLLSVNILIGFMLISETCRNRLELNTIREMLGEKGEELACRMNDMNREQVSSIESFCGEGRSVVESQYKNLTDEIEEIGRRLYDVEHNLSIVNTKSKSIEKRVNEISVPDNVVPEYVVEQKKQAEKYFEQKQYKECSQACVVVKDFYVNDFDFVFMRYYSLFKTNPNASRNYAEISMNLNNIRERGYRNKLMDEVLEYIKNESM